MGGLGGTSWRRERRRQRRQQRGSGQAAANAPPRLHARLQQAVPQLCVCAVRFADSGEPQHGCVLPRVLLCQGHAAERVVVLCVAAGPPLHHRFCPLRAPQVSAGLARVITACAECGTRRVGWCPHAVAAIATACVTRRRRQPADASQLPCAFTAVRGDVYTRPVECGSLLGESVRAGEERARRRSAAGRGESGAGAGGKQLARASTSATCWVERTSEQQRPWQRIHRRPPSLGPGAAAAEARVL